MVGGDDGVFSVYSRGWGEFEQDGSAEISPHHLSTPD